MSSGTIVLPNGDMIFTTLDVEQGPFFGCLNPETGIGKGSQIYKVVGGTGRFFGATGELRDDVTVIVRELNPFDPLNRVSMGSFFGRTWGTIQTDGD